MKVGIILASVSIIILVIMIYISISHLECYEYSEAYWIVSYDDRTPSNKDNQETFYNYKNALAEYQKKDCHGLAAWGYGFSACTENDTENDYQISLIEHPKECKAKAIIFR